MRTTISIDENLLNTIKQRAAASGSTVSRIIEDAVRHALSLQEVQPVQEFKLITWGDGERPPDFNLDKAWQLLEIDELSRYQQDR